MKLSDEGKIISVKACAPALNAEADELLTRYNELADRIFATVTGSLR